MTTNDDNGNDRDKLDKLILLFLAAMMVYGREYAEGSLSPAALPALIMPVIAEYHARAAVLGRQAAGDTAPIDEADLSFGQAAAESDRPFLQEFADSLAKSDDAATEAAVSNRLRLYAERLHATAHEAYVMASPDGTMFTWHLGANENHCPDCPQIAAGSPYAADELPTYPGSGATKCLTNCKCWLETEDGNAPFAGG